MNKEKSIAVLNILIEINNDKIEGYKTASKETEETDLDNLFFQLMQTSKKCKTELISEVLQQGGKPAEGVKSTSLLFRIWSDIKIALIGKNRQLILKACEYSEYIAVKAYRRALINDLKHFTIDQQYLLNSQLILITNDHEYLKGLCNLKSA